jgi:hypothetical protein
MRTLLTPSTIIYLGIVMITPRGSIPNVGLSVLTRAGKERRDNIH